MSEIRQQSDHEIFRLFVEDGKPEHLFRELMSRFKQQVYRQVRRMVLTHDDADEITQMVFIKLWKNAETFKFNSALSSFIYRIAYNESITFLKQKKRFISFDDALNESPQIFNSTSPSGIDGNRILRKLENALLTLPEKQRLVFNYKYFEDLPYKTISEITGTSEGALKASYHHAVEKIKTFLESN